MIAATRSQKRVIGEQLEDLDKNPSKFQKELKRIVQKNKNKKVTVERKVTPTEEAETVEEDVPELPFRIVLPLPVVERGQTKTKVAPTNDVNDENIFEIPELPRELSHMH